ncbi:MAG: cysteine desulfurase family protein [Acidobacteriota bacterium]|nr:cysteine desulfurase family protein [Acidobacteriota bacterium]
MPEVYLDHQATTPPDPAVLETMLPYFTHKFGNAASSHAWGSAAAAAVENARERVAELIGGHPLAVTFTGGATESVNLALKGLADQYGSKRRHIVTCVTEHPAVRDTCARLSTQGFEITELGVDPKGHIDENELAEAVTPETLVVSLMFANNEVGTIHPVARYAEIAHAHGAFFHCDATQAVGKLPVHVDELNIDLLSLSAHKFYGPMGIGALYRRLKRPRVRLAPQIHGGGHERGMRSGTLNVPSIVGLGEACRIARDRMADDAAHTRALADRFLKALGGIPYELNGDPVNRLPGNLNLRFPGISAASLIEELPDIAVSTGSACSSARPGASHVLSAMGLGGDAAAQSVRLGCGRFTTETEIDYAARRFKEAIARLGACPREAEACSL